MAKTYYAEELTAVPFMTMAKALSNTIPAPIAYPIAACFRLRGLVRWPLKPTYGVGELGSELEVEKDALPPRALAKMAPLFETLHDLGFTPLKFAIADVIGEKEHVAALWMDQQASTLATCEWMRMRGADGVEEATPVELNSYCGDDPDLMTGWLPKEHIALSEMLRLDFVEMHCVANSTPLRVAYERHQQRSAARSDLFQMTREAALEEHQRRAQRRFDWVVDRGLLRPMSPKEVQRVKQLALPAATPARTMY